MSRPPLHRDRPSPRAGTPAEHPYFEPDFSALVDLAVAVAREQPHNLEIPEKGRGLARTLAEIPALFAHILGEHQSLYAREAYIGTARSPEALGRHARRLAYAPDAGVSATGLVTFTARPGLSGEIPAGFAVRSVPHGEAGAETYETLAPLTIDAAWNTMRPADAMRPTAIDWDAEAIILPLERSHRFDPEDIVLLQGAGREGAGRAALYRVADSMRGEKAVGLRRIGPAAKGPTGALSLHVRPRLRARLMGWDADAAVFPPAALREAKAYDPERIPDEKDGEGDGWVVPGAVGDALYLSTVVTAPSPGAPVVILPPEGDPMHSRLIAAREMRVFYRRGVRMARTTTPVDTTRDTDAAGIPLIETSIGGKTTAFMLETASGGAAMTWNDGFPVEAEILADWADVIPVAPEEPNPQPLLDNRQPLTIEVATDLTGIRPGRQVILMRRDGDETLETRAAFVTELPDIRSMTLALHDGATLHRGWRKENVEVAGNVARISHGETTQETLGGSDGVTPHQSFALKSGPVSRSPGPEGPEIDLEIRVDGVRWSRVTDFHGAGPDARVYRVETDADRTTRIVFGGEGRAAIPPAGEQNVTARYRVGLGKAGNAGPERLVRIPKASPVLDVVINLLPITGGRDPSQPSELAVLATRPTRVFDRAVSVSDHADLALLYPGVVRADARRLGRGVALIVAGPEGAQIENKAALRQFMDARRDAGAPLTIEDATATPVAVRLKVTRHPDWLSDAVRLAVEQALVGRTPPGLLTFSGRRLGEAAALSGLYARIGALPGVMAVRAEQFARAGEAGGIADILKPAGRGRWLDLTVSDASLQVTVLDPGGGVAEGGAEGEP